MAKAAAKAIARAKAKAKARAQAKAKAKAKVQVEAKAMADVQAKAYAQAKAKAFADAKTRAEADKVKVEVNANPPQSCYPDMDRALYCDTPTMHTICLSASPTTTDFHPFCNDPLTLKLAMRIRGGGRDPDKGGS